MTVAELLAILVTLPAEATVIFHDEEIAVDDGERTLAQIDEHGVLLHGKGE
jgi:hypothetical protein